MFIWDFVADKILGQIVDWFYSQVVGFLGNFFSEMGSMGAELFEMNWVQSVVLFFSYLGWALFATGLVVAVFECGIEYSAGRGNVKETALNVLKGFLAVSLFTQVPVRLYSLAISLQGTLTAGITGFGSTSIGDAAKAALADLENLESLTESTYPLRGFGRETSGLMVLFCLILMAYAVIKVFFANLKRGGILLIQIAVGSLYMFSVPRGYAPKLGYALLASGEAERSRLWKKKRTSARPSRCRCTSGFGRSRSSGARPWPTTSRTYSENILKEEYEL